MGIAYNMARAGLHRRSSLSHLKKHPTLKYNESTVILSNEDDESPIGYLLDTTLRPAAATSFSFSHRAWYGLPRGTCMVLASSDSVHLFGCYCSTLSMYVWIRTICRRAGL